MTRIIIFCSVLFLVIVSCGLHQTGNQKANTGSVQTSKNEVAAGTNLVMDTNRITILTNAAIDFFSLNDSLPATLTGKDIQLIETLLTNAIKDYNKNKDIKNLYGGYINNNNYNRQYVPYTNTSGEKKVFINCFCSGIEQFNYWKKQLVMVDDGGVCFFNVTINLKQQACGPLLINGPG